MIQFSDLRMLLDLAKSAPLQRAGDAKVVSAMFDRIEASIQEGAEQAALEAALAKQPKAPSAPIAAAVAQAVAEAAAPPSAE